MCGIGLDWIEQLRAVRAEKATVRIAQLRAELDQLRDKVLRSREQYQKVSSEMIAVAPQVHIALMCGLDCCGLSYQLRVVLKFGNPHISFVNPFRFHSQSNPIQSNLSQFKIKSAFKLVEEEACYSIALEVQSPIDVVALQSSVPIMLLDVDTNVAIVSHTAISPEVCFLFSCFSVSFVPSFLCFPCCCLSFSLFCVRFFVSTLLLFFL